MGVNRTIDKIKENLFFKLSGIIIISITLAMIFFILYKGVDLFIKNGYSILNFVFSTNWMPDSEKNPSFGAGIFILGSIFVSAFAVLLSTPFALCVSIFSVEISKSIGKRIVNPFIEILVGIPSVVYGWIGLSLLVPFIRQHFGGMGFSLLAGGIVLAIMIFPTITSVSMEALKNVSDDHRTASLALGATRWQTIKKVVIPTATPGILTGVVLGLSRAFGEALAVQMVIGNAIKIPGSILDSTSTLTSIITMDMANTIGGTAWNNALWSMAVVLLVISFVFIIILKQIGKKGAKA